MSGRPKIPDWTVAPFAPDTNYAAGALPWEGLPTKVAWAGASSVGFTPKKNVPAQAINYLFNAAFSQHDSVKTSLTDLLAFVGQGSVLNFPIKLNVGQDATRAFYVAATSGTRGERRWILVGDAQLQEDVGDGGHTFLTGDLVAGAGGAGEEPIDGDYDNTGAIVVTTDTKYIFHRDNASGALAKLDAFGTAIAGASSDVVYDPIHSLWCVASIVTAGGSPMRIRTSPDRTTWTTRTVPFGGGSTSGLVRLACNRATGRIVVVNLISTTTAQSIGYSDDGGVTWTNGTPLTTIASLDFVDLQYNPTTTNWMLTFCKNYSTEVWKSPDGITWTKLVTLTASRIFSIAPFGNMWVALAKQQTTSIIEMVYSTDLGATWNLAGLQFQGFPTGVFASPDQLVVPTSGDTVYVGHRMGSFNYGSLT